MRRLFLFLLLLVVPGSACSYFPEAFKVGREFSIHVSNVSGPFQGLKLRIETFSKRKDELVPAIDREVVTDEKGDARVSLDRDGSFTLEVIHPAATLSWWGLEVSDEHEQNVINLAWPNHTPLITARLRGNIFDGLMSSKSAPLKGATLSLYDRHFSSKLKQLVVDDTGKFDFGDRAPGLYFVRVAGKGLAKFNDDSWIIRGDIPVVLTEKGRESLSIATWYSSCGLSYDLVENKDKYKPELCIKGGKEIPCNY